MTKEYVSDKKDTTGGGPGRMRPRTFFRESNKASNIWRKTQH